MFSYDLGKRASASRYDYLYRCIRHDIAHGTIAPGEKLPSKRALAKHLGVGVITVEAAYAQLVAEGYVRAEERRGYFACELAPAARPVGPGAVHVGGKTPARLPDAARGKGVPCEGLCEEGAYKVGAQAAISRLETDDRRASRPRFNEESRRVPRAGSSAPESSRAFAGSAATALFPYATWAKIMRRTLSEETSASLAEAAGAQGSIRLRRAISSYLWECRGFDAPAECIVVAAGSQVLYQSIVQLLGRDRVFAVECPGYPLLVKAYRAQGARVELCSVDEGGISMSDLRESGADVAHVMPAHQFPTGVVASAARRRDLLNWSREHDKGTGRLSHCAAAGACDSRAPGRFIVEDDYDAEFRMTGRPIPPLASIDSVGRVIYLNSFAKSLGAAFRIAYMVLPPTLADAFEDRLGFYSNTVSPLDQLALARFIEDGCYERHVSRLRTQAKRVQDDVAGLLRESGLDLDVSGLDCGLHFVARRKGADAEELARDIAAACSPAGVRAVPLRSFAPPTFGAPGAAAPLRSFALPTFGAPGAAAAAGGASDRDDLGIWGDFCMVNYERAMACAAARR